MTTLEAAPIEHTIEHTIEPSIDYGLYDADEHYYEAEDALTRHLEKEHRNVVKWAEINGRKSLLIHDRLLTIVPNPTYDPVGVPGSIEIYFRAQNHDGIPLRDLMKSQPIQPEYRNRDARVARMDQQGVDFTWLLPSLGLGVEEMLSKDPASAHAVFRAYNRWLDEDWGYDRDGRLQTGPLISLLDPVEAERELARVIELGAKFVTMRPAPVAFPGKHRSPGDPAHDRIWAMMSDANIVLGIHAADSGYSKYLEDWGEHGQYTGMKGSPLTEVLSIGIERPIYDMIAALICHGVFDRFPKLRVAALELGAAWVPSLVRRLGVSYGKTPQAYGSDPVEQFRKHVWVAPFYEDDIRVLRDALGAERILLGSDWPHPEGLSEPRKWIPDFLCLEPHEQRMALRDNLKSLSGR